MEEGLYIYIKFAEQELLLTKLKIDQDGSIIFSEFPTNSNYTTSMRLNISNEKIETNEFEDIIKPKDIHVTYHVTGQVNYRGMTCKKSKLFESLNKITEKNMFFNIFIPKDLLHDKIEKKKTNITLEVENDNLNYIGICFCVEPVNDKDVGYIVNDIYKISFLHINESIFDSIMKKYDYKKILIIYPLDIFNLKTPISEEKKLQEILNYKKKLYSIQDGGIFYNKGKYIIIFPVIMRVRPKFKIEFEDSNVYARIINESKKTERIILTFQAYNKHGIIKNRVQKIKNVVLDSEIYDDDHIWGKEWL